MGVQNVPLANFGAQLPGLAPLIANAKRVRMRAKCRCASIEKSTSEQPHISTGDADVRKNESIIGMEVMPDSIDKPHLYFLVAWVVTVGYALVRELYHLKLGRASIYWAKAAGVVTRIEIRDRKDDDGYSFFFPVIEYKYRFDSLEFSSNRVSFNDLDVRSYAEVLERWTGITKGSRIDVFVNSEKPAQSVLIKGYELSGYVSIVAISGVLAFSLSVIAKAMGP